MVDGMDNAITIEQVESLAEKLEADERAQREKAMRLIRAHCRILAVREPERFASQPLEYRDEEGHWDGSYPPDQTYQNHSGPRLIEIRDCRTEQIATSGGFYHSWKLVTVDRGLWVDARGRLFEVDESGTGRVGQYAAHPGAVDVEVALEWRPAGDVSTADLLAAERTLRALAFPASARAAAAS
jgi:hypothetical protein